MDVVLSQKDADWIASVIREKLHDLDMALEDAKKEGESRYQACVKLANLAGINPDDNSEGRSLNEVRDSAYNSMVSEYKANRAKYERIIELMICGS